MTIVYVGIDLAKNVFACTVWTSTASPRWCAGRAACQAARAGRLAAAVHHRHGSLLRRAPLGAAVRAHGHTVRLMAPKFVSPYRMSGKRGKNDAADAAAICEAVQRPPCASCP
jgi:transposase